MDEAIVRWREACDSNPARTASWCRLAAIERQHGVVERAKEAVAQALSKNPDAADVLLEAARVHDRAGALDVSITFWERLATRRRARAVWRQGYADALIRLDRLDEAEAVLRQGFARHPGHRGLTATSGLLAMRRQDWDAAFAIWSAYGATYPDDELGRVYLARVSGIRLLAEAEAQERPPQLLAPVEVERVEDEEVRQLMLRFEGIGVDCEFGTVQRRFGAEPLGLLRWNDVTFPTLVAALEAGFAGMGDPGMTDLVAGSVGELYVRDRRWDLGMHTFLFASEVSSETLFPKMCRRVAFLKDKFLADLRDGEKVLVFKSDDLVLAELKHLHGLLKGFGPARLLHVRLAVSAGLAGWPEAAAGEIAEIAPDLLVGYVRRLGDLYDVPYGEWTAICRAVERHYAAGGAARVEAGRLI